MSRFAIGPNVWLMLALAVAPIGCSLVGCSLTRVGGIGTRPSTADRSEHESTGDKLLGDLAGGSLLGHDDPGPSKEPVGLYAITPYDPAKIPVVLIHGSSPRSADWDRLLSPLRDDPQIVQNYQFWKFLYATDSSFVKSASDLRAALNDAVEQLDRQHKNPQLTRIVLIGHGIGGLIANLQAAHSDQQLWNAVSTLPLEDLALESQVRAVVRQTLYFEPQPMVGAVIAIGSAYEPFVPAEHPAHDFGSRLKQFPQSIKEGYKRMIGDSDELLIDLTTGLPTLADERSPNSPILNAAQQLRVANDVRFHSITRQPDDLLTEWELETSRADREEASEVVQASYVAAGQGELLGASETARTVRDMLIDNLEPVPEDQRPNQPVP